MTAGFCRCGCGTSLAGRRQGTVWATDGCRKAFERLSESEKADRTRTRPGGLQVSYRKAERMVVAKLAGPPLWVQPGLAVRLVDEVLRGALSEAQRERLEARR